MPAFKAYSSCSYRRVYSEAPFPNLMCTSSPTMAPTSLKLRPSSSRSRVEHGLRTTLAALVAIVLLLLWAVPQPEQEGLSEPQTGTLSVSRVAAIIANNTDLIYLPTADVLLMTVAKGGSSTTWHWVYAGLTGRKNFNRTACEARYAQDFESPCWAGHVVLLSKLPLDQARAALTGPTTLRIAVQRNPFERLLSSFKSKFACDDAGFGTDLDTRGYIVPMLLRHAGEPPGPKCLTVTQFANALEAAAARVSEGKMPPVGLRSLDVHVRPSRYFFDEVPWDLVLDTRDLSNSTILRPLVQRMPFGESVKGGPVKRHSSKPAELVLPKDAERKLRHFSLLSEVGERRVELSAPK